jgi:hypothetical protein
MSMVKRAWFVASVIVALAALGAGSLGLIGSPVTSPAGALVIAVGLMPAALLLAGRPSRRRMIGVFHVAAGTTLGIAGFVLASQDNFLRLTMASIDFRALATSGPGSRPRRFDGNRGRTDADGYRFAPVPAKLRGSVCAPGDPHVWLLRG